MESCGAMDAFLTALFKDIFADTPHISLIALGGYGRQEMCPFSDLDFMFLTAVKQDETLEKKVEQFLYVLWDLKLKIGHSVRTPAEAIKQAGKDMVTLTSLMDARFITGSAPLYDLYDQRMTRFMNRRRRKKYIRDKLEEREDRHIRLGNVRFTLEPNIKDGKGGLRDLQTILWLGRALNREQPLGFLDRREMRSYTKAHDFLLTVRCHLHDLAGRTEERLHFDIQPALAERLGYSDTRQNLKGVERFMRHYFLVTRDVGDLTRTLCAAVDTRQERNLIPVRKIEGFVRQGRRLTFSDPEQPLIDPVHMLRLFNVAQINDLDIHPDAIRAIRRHIKLINDDIRNDPAANAIFLDILTARKRAALTLRRMNEADLLGRFIPDFGRIIALMQFDRYHYYTVDEHTLRCLKILHDIEDGQRSMDLALATHLFGEIENRKTLYVALFLHDICKGRGGNHSKLGARLCMTLAPRFGLSAGGTKLAAWLIEHHLKMSDTAFKRDLHDPQAIVDFAALVENREKLNLLTLLTTADISGVGPDRWTGWKAQLIETLHALTTRYLEENEVLRPAPPHLPKEYKFGQTKINFKQDKNMLATVVEVITPDRAGLFGVLAGALYQAGGTIIEARIHTHSHEKAGDTAQDLFTIQNLSGLPFTQERRLKEIRDHITASLSGTAAPVKQGAPAHKRDMVFPISTRVRWHNDISAGDTVLEVETRDRPGLLYDITTFLHAEGIEIRSAKINTTGLRVFDVFYIRRNNVKIPDDEAPQLCEHISKALS